MLGRRGFIGVALAFAAVAGPRGARAIETPGGAPSRDSRDGRLALDAVDVLIATQPRVRMIWKMPAAFTPAIPIAYYAGPGDEGAGPEIWLNADHPELVSPRLSRLTDEIPLFAELLLASVDVRPPGVASLGLDALPPDQRRLAAGQLAGRVAVVTRYTAYPAVDDAEFARRAFAFDVLRRMTPAIRDLPHDAAPREDWIRGFVLSAAERRPREDRVHAAYDAARISDDATRSWDARRAFAAPYVAQVAALVGP